MRRIRCRSFLRRKERNPIKQKKKSMEWMVRKMPGISFVS
jgi:hypothetical protein